MLGRGFDRRAILDHDDVVSLKEPEPNDLAHRDVAFRHSVAPHIRFHMRNHQDASLDATSVTTVLHPVDRVVCRPPDKLDERREDAFLHNAVASGDMHLPPSAERPGIGDGMRFDPSASPPGDHAALLATERRWQSIRLFRGRVPPPWMLRFFGAEPPEGSTRQRRFKIVEIADAMRGAVFSQVRPDGMADVHRPKRPAS